MNGRFGVRAGLVAVVAVTLAGLVTGCGGGGEASGPTTIRFVWWGNEDRAKATKSAVEAFMKDNPGITVQTEYAAYDAYFQKLSTQVAGGASPDLIQLDRATLGEYQHRHVLEDLSPYVGKAIDVTGIAPALLAGGKVEGRQYAVPGGQTTQMLAYDPEIFAKAGVEPPSGPGKTWTWAQFGESLRKVAATGVAGTTDFGWAIDWFEVWLHQHGKQLYADDGKLGFTAADLTQFWTLTGGLRADKAVTAPEVTTKMDGSMPNSGLVTKRAGSEINYDSSLSAYLSSYGPGIKAAPLPADGPASGMAAMPPVTFAVAQRSAHKEAAAKLLSYLVNNQQAGKLLGVARGLPPNTAIREQVCGAAQAATKAVCDYEKSVADRIGPATGLWPTGSAAVKRDFQRVYDDVIFGRTSVADGAARVVQTAQQSLGS
ncbi:MULTISPECIES: ABC transporter substrate-binding protein [Amycolatopsis]|uniref:Sugar ABC transporter substrate-binding protein n=1 Tax=Amycolatopsis bullii TaxID=941987 RepID=A0ABQ3KC18_9PSEU|nr:extracellular solute-binding protein [Amycolatopsis bullii]GHG12521.1 sugar ABC transporter substrate-binding protein [Amycolatopsis bullii]